MRYRANIIETLRRFEAEQAVRDARSELEYRKYRASVVAEFGIEWVEQVEREIRDDRKY